jgi:hypothetical protein
MAFEYHAPFHVVTTEDGDKKLVSEIEWGRYRLSGDDLIQYDIELEEAAQKNIRAVESGQMIISNIEETVPTSFGQSVTVVTGFKFFFPGATEKYIFHPNFFKYADRMKADTNTVYKDPFWVDATP